VPCTLPTSLGGARWAHSTRHRHFLGHKGVKISFEVTTLDIVAPLTLALDGDAAVFLTTMAVKLGTEVSRGDTHHWHTRSSRRVSNQWRTCC
jgi:hypothetical protein